MSVESWIPPQCTRGGRPGRLGRHRGRSRGGRHGRRGALSLFGIHAGVTQRTLPRAAATRFVRRGGRVFCFLLPV